MASARVAAALRTNDEAELRAALMSYDFLPSDMTTFMVFAMMEANPGALRVLIQHGADVNADVGELTALTFACHYGSVAIVQVLLDAGADINRKAKFGACPLLMAALQNHTEVCQLLILRVKDVMLEKIPAEKLVDKTYSSTPSLQPSTISNLTPLMSAACHGNTAIVSMLIKAGAAVDAKDDKGSTVLMCAAENNHVGVLQGLLDAGAQVDATNKNKLTAMMAAANCGSLAAVKYLLDHEAHLNCQAIDGGTALLVAAMHGHEGIVRLLIERGADLDCQDKVGDTALTKATNHGHRAIVALLEAGAAERKSRLKHWLVQSSVANLAKRSLSLWAAAHGK